MNKNIIFIYSLMLMKDNNAIKWIRMIVLVYILFLNNIFPPQYLFNRASSSHIFKVIDTPC